MDGVFVFGGGNVGVHGKIQVTQSCGSGRAMALSQQPVRRARGWSMHARPYDRSPKDKDPGGYADICTDGWAWLVAPGHGRR
jgi:hypothetical protein